MKRLIEKLNLTQLTIAYGMSACLDTVFLSPVLESLIFSYSGNEVCLVVQDVRPTPLKFVHLYCYSPVSFQTTPDDPIIKRVETVGRIHPHVKAKIVDPSGNTVPVNTPGELLVAGYSLQKG